MTISKQTAQLALNAIEAASIQPTDETLRIVATAKAELRGVLSAPDEPAGAT